MYLDYFGLEREPFTISPDPAFLYPSPQHRQALAHLKYGLDREGGFILLTGEVGTGKTTLTRLLLEQLPGNVRVAYILNAKLDSRDVLASICSELQLDYPENSSDKALTDLIYRDLLAAHSVGKKTLLVLEEAQNLDPEVLEMLRLLTNLETNTTKLLHILLVGQPELLDLIARNELRQLNQRVVSRFHIEPLSLEETNNYLAHRLRRAGGRQHPFEPAAIRTLHKKSGGIPRMLNLIGERALLGTYATGGKQVSPAIVEAAYKEVFGTPSDKKTADSNTETQKKKPLALILVACLVLLLVVAGLFYGWSSMRSDTRSSSAENLITATPNAAQPISTAAGQVDRPVPDNASDIEPVGGNDPASNEYQPNVVEPLVANQSVSITQPVMGNAYEQLLAIWGVNADVSARQFCSTAEANGLLCQQEDDLQLDDLGQINRPGLLVLAVDDEIQQRFVLISLTETQATLRNSSTEILMPLAEFSQKWQGDFSYLWRPPVPYQQPLMLGGRDNQLLAWTQQQLMEIFEGYEYIFTGGLYTRPIADAVLEFQILHGLRADSMIGPRTILRLMDETENLPVLAQKDSISVGAEPVAAPANTEATD